MHETKKSRGPLLVGRSFIVKSRNTGRRCTWHSPLEYLKDRYPSVVKAEHTDTTSSAGDWSGYIIQHVRKSFFLIQFWQENRYPNDGFSVTTADGWLLKGQSLEAVLDAYKETGHGQR